jgi:hypothetical protein
MTPIKPRILAASLAALSLFLCSCTIPTLVFSVPSTITNGQQAIASVSLLNAPTVASLSFTVNVASYTAAAGALPSIAFSAAPPVVSGAAVDQLTCQAAVDGSGFQCKVTPLAGSAALPSGAIATFSFIVNGTPAGPAVPSVTGISATDAAGNAVGLSTVLPLSVTIQ